MSEVIFVENTSSKPIISKQLSYKFPNAKTLTVNEIKHYNFSCPTHIFTLAKHFADVDSLDLPEHSQITYFSSPKFNSSVLLEFAKHKNSSIFPVSNTWQIKNFDKNDEMKKIYVEKNHRSNILAFNDKLRKTWNKYFKNYSIKSLTHLFYYQLTCKFDDNSPFLRERESEDMRKLVYDQITIHSQSKDQTAMNKCCDELMEIIKNFEIRPCREEPTSPKISYNEKEIQFSDKSWKYSISIKKEMIDKLKKYYKGSNFLVDAFVMLFRYQTLGKLGKDTMQLSLPDNYHEKLASEHYNVECFASPINRHFDKFFSAFPDTDSCFGSLGSFFDNGYEVLSSDNYSGSCDCPYQIHAIEKCVDLIHDLLKNSKFTHRFKFALPLWKDADFYHKLKDSEFMKTFEEIDQDKLQYKLHKVGKDDEPIFPCASLISVQSNDENYHEEPDEKKDNSIITNVRHKILNMCKDKDEDNEEETAEIYMSEFEINNKKIYIISDSSDIECIEKDGELIIK